VSSQQFFFGSSDVSERLAIYISEYYAASIQRHKGRGSRGETGTHGSRGLASYCTKESEFLIWKSNTDH
jgi:hypothetical protein